MNKPDDYSDIVYKYRNWTDEYHKDVLLKNHLFLTSPKNLNDPFDCRIPTNYKLLDTKEKRRKYVEQATIRQFDQLVRDGRDIKKEMERIENRLTNETDKLQVEREQQLFECQDKHYGVLSLSTRWDSILMWSHYADHHKGYCVGLWEDKLRNSLFGKGGPVTYNPKNNYPQIDPLDNNILKKSFQETHSKAYDWAYEQEYRLTKLLFPGVPTDNDRTVKIPDDFFAEIIIGLKTPANHRKEIIEIAKQKGIKTYKVKKVPFKFQIDRQEIK